MNTTAFSERCRVAHECLPHAEYRERLTALHAEMLSALAQAETAQPARMREFLQPFDDPATGALFAEACELGGAAAQPASAPVESLALRACQMLIDAARVTGNSFIAPTNFAPAVRAAGAAVRAARGLT